MISDDRIHAELQNTLEQAVFPAGIKAQRGKVRH